ncbi:hypothetical protein V7S43_017999 [Phytophthora oleae]|uniref:Uncharacterized protein n=1 Tax=Phytophthora oleae TaxID=2107226 RepID=A0ABD3EUX7_9STRA
MATPPSGRPPDEIVPESPTSGDESQDMINRIRLHEEIVPDSQDSTLSDYEFPPRKLQRRIAGWSVLQDRVHDAMQQVRVLIFVHTSDAKLCLDNKCRQSGNDLNALRTFVKEDLGSETDPHIRSRKTKAQDDRIDEMLSHVAVHVLCGHVWEYRPLLAKLSIARCHQLAEVFDGSQLSTLDQAVDVLIPKPWFHFQTQPNTARHVRSLQDLGKTFDHISKWPCEEGVHESKRDAFDTKAQRAREVSNLTGTVNVLKCTAKTHAEDIETASALRKDIREKSVRRSTNELHVVETA